MKKRGLIIITLFVIGLAAANVYLFSNKGNISYQSMSGRFVEEIPELPWGLNLSLTAFVLQWIILIVIILFAYARFLKHKKLEHVNLTYQEIKKMETRSRTDLDILYNLLRQKRRLSTGTIAKVFRINKEKALEWGKILENHGLVTIEYPAFNDPEITINEKKSEEKTEETGKKKGKEKHEEKKKGNLQRKTGKKNKNKTIRKKK